MSTKIFLGIMVAILAVAGYVAYKNYLDTEEGTPATAESNGVSFICEDSSYFVAEFSPDFSRLNIVIDGVVDRSLPRQGGDQALYRYAEGGRTYLFAGEEARVSDAGTGRDTTCHQPFDPNNASYNFGDQGEGGGAETDVAAAARANLVGTWQSRDDAKFIREFQADGTAIDRYDGTPDAPGSWQTFTSESGVATPFPLDAGAAYLKMEIGGDEEMLYFKVATLTPERLDLVYMNRGGVLSFNRLP